MAYLRSCVRDDSTSPIGACISDFDFFSSFFSLAGSLLAGELETELGFKVTSAL